MTNIDKMLSVSRQLTWLLENKEPGLMTWQTAVKEHMRQISDFYLGSVPYPEFCRHPDKCRGLGCCPRDPCCCD